MYLRKNFIVISEKKKDKKTPIIAKSGNQVKETATALSDNCRRQLL